MLYARPRVTHRARRLEVGNECVPPPAPSPLLPASEFTAFRSTIASAFRARLRVTHRGQPVARSPRGHSPVLPGHLLTDLPLSLLPTPPDPAISCPSPQGASEKILGQSLPILTPPLVLILVQMSPRGCEFLQDQLWLASHIFWSMFIPLPSPGPQQSNWSLLFF